MRRRMKIRRLKYRLTRLVARTTPGTALRTLLALGVAGTILYAAATQLRPVALEIAGEWAIAGRRFATGRIGISVEAESGKLLMGSVLPSFGEASFEPEPLDVWERPLRGLDSHSDGVRFLHATQLAGGRGRRVSSVGQRSLDIVRLPQGASDAPRTGAGNEGKQAPPEARPGSCRRPGPGRADGEGLSVTIRLLPVRCGIPLEGARRPVAPGSGEFAAPVAARAPRWRGTIGVTSRVS